MSQNPAMGGGDATPADSPDPEPTVSTSAATANSTASASRDCGPDDVTITTAANPASVPLGDPLTFDVSFAQSGSTACLIDTEAQGTELLITSGEDRIYSSTDCPDDAAIAPTRLIMEPGAKEMVAASWSGQRSRPECATETAEPGAGTYNATVTVQGISSEPAVFSLT